jgi:hypothetical protein
MSTTINTYYEGLISSQVDIKNEFVFLHPIDQQPNSGTPDNNDLEKHYVDAKAFILSATTKDGSNL